MKDPCVDCVVSIICFEMCSMRDEYTQFYEDDLNFFIRRLKSRRNEIEDFDKKYFETKLKYDEIIKENIKRFSSSSTSSSGYWWSVSSPRKIKGHDWMPCKNIKKTDYLKEKRFKCQKIL